MALTLVTLWIGACLVSLSAAESPVVTLNHGGQLRGMSSTFQNVPVDLFLGKLNIGRLLSVN